MERLEDFLKKFQTWPQTLQDRALTIFGQKTMEAMGESKRVAPKRKGFLIRSARNISAKITPHGIRSAYQFTVPYAGVLEFGGWQTGKLAGKKLTVSQKVNSAAQTGFGQKGIDLVMPKILDEIKRLVGVSFGEL